jgi:hypothetical protein
VLPEPERNRYRVNVEPTPPSSLIAIAVQFAMVSIGVQILHAETQAEGGKARRKIAASDGLARAFVALGKHLEGVRPGLWIERIDASGQPGGNPAPATSLYHLTAALTDRAVLALGR